MTAVPILLLLMAYHPKRFDPVNAPHYMATIYRAYRTREDLSRYRVVTVYFVAVRWDERNWAV